MCACAGILGLDDGHPRDDGGVSVEDAGRDGTVAPGDDGASPPVDDAMGLPGADGSPDAEGTGDAGVDATDSAVSVPVPDGGYPCDPTWTLVDGGIFVSSGEAGSDTTGCGTQAQPCGTIQKAIGLANNSSSPPPVYVQAGTYEESLSLFNGTTIIGGWSASAATPWVRDCSETVLKAPAGTTTTVTVSSGTPATATLSSLVITSEDGANVQPGQTLVGCLASGSATLVLKNVEIALAAGGAGANGQPATAATPPSGACAVAAAADGGSSTSTGGKGVGADAGWFSATSYVTMAGGTGGPGGGGMNGVAGGPGACVQCLAGCNQAVLCSATDAGTECGDQGLPGCGGAGGPGGPGGASGGSSIAVLASGSAAVVQMSGCVLVAGSGGNGGMGGAGGGGARGSSGAVGADSLQSCDTACGMISVSCTLSDEKYGQGGADGGNGGSGAAGGAGGDGAGGNSYGIVQINGAKVQPVAGAATTGTVFILGDAGVSAGGSGNGAPGVSVATVIVQ